MTLLAAVSTASAYASGVITSIQVKTPSGWKFVSRDLWSDRNKEKYDNFPWE